MSAPDRYTCEEVLARLDDYLDRELAPADMAAVQAHLRTCGQCAREHAFEARVLDGVSQKLGRIRAPETLVRGVKAIIDEERRHRPS